MTTPRSARRLSAAAVMAAAALGLTACAGGADDAASSSSSAPTAATSSAPAEGQGAPLTVSDPWTKATEDGMTGSFGLLENSSDEDLHVVGVSAEVGAKAGLHVMVADEDGQMVMQQSPDGFTVPAGGSFELAPGGAHVMLMGLTEPIEPGEEVAYELELEDGSTVEVVSVARPYTGANESYHGGGAEESDEHADH
ncbi:copper chaperone PCu(A)C [Micrococcus endophyticus]|uniref:copper chaperone PCu(A)C n=1 Tax=Micrococcus endophyticus TaxID=455343 RepID=UPI0020036321|nr:copper chaperone PCu(A)C [Micrococcus endophyticus]MCK6089962.1 copper chaperone PCu(A)C [Micrococcus endophyticus]